MYLIMEIYGFSLPNFRENFLIFLGGKVFETDEQISVLKLVIHNFFGLEFLSFLLEIYGIIKKLFSSAEFVRKYSNLNIKNLCLFSQILTFQNVASKYSEKYLKLISKFLFKRIF